MANEYVILNENKEASHSFSKKKGGGYPWKEVKDFDNIGLIVPAPFIVLDFDTTSDAEIMLQLIEDLDLKCRVMKTTRGIHVWFKHEEPWKCFIKTRLAIGVYADCKSHSKNAYVKIKNDGIERVWIRKTPLDEIEEVPHWLYPVSCPSDKYAFKGMGEGDGRNQELFSYIVYLQSKGFKKDDVIDTINVVNQYVFADPLEDKEISMICRNDAFKSDEEIQEQLVVKQGFSHNEFGDNLIQLYNVVGYNNQLYVYEDGYYQPDDRIVEGKMIEMFPSIKTAQRAEVLNYLKIKCHITREDIKVNLYVINLKNTRLDIRTNTELPFDPTALEFNRIPVSYDPSAYSGELDKMLNRVFLGDEDVIRLFDEMGGYLLMNHCRYQKAFMFYGSGSNGKSTIIDLIKKFIGERNYSTMGLDELVERFKTAELDGMVANIGDDLNNKMINDTGTIKKIISGQALQVERKGERPYAMISNAKNIFSANAIPSSFDKSNGFYRRWCFIPFNAVFSSDDDDFDPYIEDKITTDDALSYLLNRFLKGAKRLIKNGKFTEPECVKEALLNYQIDNSTTLTWAEEIGLVEDKALETSTAELYSDFQDWCKLSGVKTSNMTGKKMFFKELKTKFGFAEKTKQKSDGKRYFVMDI